MTEKNEFLESDMYKKHGWKAYLPFYANKYVSRGDYGDYTIWSNPRSLMIDYSQTVEIPPSRTRDVTHTGTFDCWGNKMPSAYFVSELPLSEVHFLARKASPDVYNQWVVALAEHTLQDKKEELAQSEKSIFGLTNEAKVVKKFIDNVSGTIDNPLYAKVIIGMLNPVTVL